MKVYRIVYRQISRIGFLNLRSVNLVGVSSDLEFLWYYSVAQTTEYEEKREKKGALVVEGGQELGEERKYRINTEKDT